MTITIPQKYSMTIAGYGFSAVRTRSAESSQATELSERGANINMAKTGTLSNRTDNDTGVVAAQAGHGISTGNKVAVFWNGGVRYNMDATVSSNNITVDGGAGNNLPALNTAVFISKLSQIDDAWADTAGDAVAMLIALSSVRGHVAFREADGTLILATELLAGEPYEYYESALATNPFASVDVSKIDFFAGAVSTGAAYFRVGTLFG